MLSVLVTLLLFQGPEPKLDGGAILSILEGQHAAIKDFEFVCEGEAKWLVDSTDLYQGAPDNQTGHFQGTYAYRNDGSAYLDLYIKPFDPKGEFQYHTYALLRDRVSKVFRTPDRKSGREPVRVTAGAPSAFGFPGSPERFIFLSYWRRLSYNTKDIEIESNAWEEIDGNKVLLLTVNEFPHSHLPEKKWSKYWIDLKRGGHVVKYEFYAGPNLRY